MQKHWTFNYSLSYSKRLSSWNGWRATVSRTGWLSKSHLIFWDLLLSVVGKSEVDEMNNPLLALMYGRVSDSEKTLMFYLADAVHEVTCLEVHEWVCGWSPLDIRNRVAQASQVIRKGCSYVCKERSDHDCSSFSVYQDRAECKPRATFSSQFPLGRLFHSSFLSGTGLLAWKPYIVPQMCLKASVGWDVSFPRMRRKMLCRTCSTLQMMGFPVSVVYGPHMDWEDQIPPRFRLKCMTESVV